MRGLAGGYPLAEGFLQQRVLGHNKCTKESDNHVFVHM